jgi:hypothetical protein
MRPSDKITATMNLADRDDEDEDGFVADDFAVVVWA